MKIKERCRALDNQGVRCRRRDTMEIHYFGDDELYGCSGPTPGWVQIPVCTQHRGKNDYLHKAERTKS